MAAALRFCTGLLLALSLSTAQAEELAGSGEPLRILDISPESCARLAPYISNGDADFKPGVAADGSAVAPADLDGGYGLEARDTYHFPVKIYPLETPATEFSRGTTLEVADVAIDTKTGRITFDGKDVSGGNRALSEACAHHGRNATPR